MSRPDPLLMLADIARLASEHPDLDEALVRAVYQHQVLTTGRQATLRQARAYIGHLTSHLDEVTLRVTLGLPPPSPATVEGSIPRSQSAAATTRSARLDSRPLLGALPSRARPGGATPHERLDHRAPRDARRRTRYRTRLSAEARQAARPAAGSGARVGRVSPL